MNLTINPNDDRKVMEPDGRLHAQFRERDDAQIYVERRAHDERMAEAGKIEDKLLAIHSGALEQACADRLDAVRERDEARAELVQVREQLAQALAAKGKKRGSAAAQVAVQSDTAKSSE